MTGGERTFLRWAAHVKLAAAGDSLTTYRQTLQPPALRTHTQSPASQWKETHVWPFIQVSSQSVRIHAFSRLAPSGLGIKKRIANETRPAPRRLLITVIQQEAPQSHCPVMGGSRRQRAWLQNLPGSVAQHCVCVVKCSPNLQKSGVVTIAG